MLSFGKELSINSLQNNKNVDLFELTAFGQHSKEVEINEYVFDRVQNIVLKGGKAGYQYFHVFQQCLIHSQMTNFRDFQTERACR